MNRTLQTFARQQLKEGLAKLPEGWQFRFKLMYGGRPTRRGENSLTAEEIRARDINEVVDEMPEEKLDWAMEQMERSLVKVSRLSDR